MYNLLLKGILKAKITNQQLLGRFDLSEKSSNPMGKENSKISELNVQRVEHSFGKNKTSS